MSIVLAMLGQTTTFMIPEVINYIAEFVALGAEAGSSPKALLPLLLTRKRRDRKRGASQTSNWPTPTTQSLHDTESVLAVLMDCTPALLADRSGVIEMAGASFLASFDISGKATNGLNISDLLPSIERPDAWDILLRSAIQRGRSESDLQTSSPAGRKLWLHVTACRIDDQSNRLVVLVRDNSEYHLARQELARSVERSESLEPALAACMTARDHMHSALQEAIRERDTAAKVRMDILAAVSHELRTPLTVIAGVTDSLIQSRRDDASEGSETFDPSSIRKHVNQLLRTIDTLLQACDLTSGSIRPNWTECDIAGIAARKLLEAESAASSKGLRLQLVLDPEVPETVLLDPNLVALALEHLLDNAVKFTDEGSITLHARLSRPTGLRVTIDLVVTDTGRGIQADQLQRIGEAFHQVDGSIARQAAGLGLGLSNTKQIASLLMGSVQVESTPETGSRFTLSLPLQMPRTPEPTPIAREELHPPRILLAEDNVDIAILIRHHLRNTATSVTIAQDGEEALRYLTESGTLEGPLRQPCPFDIILLDMQMPCMDGYTVAGILRDRGCTVPVIAVTAHAGPQDRVRCLAAGCDDYLSKPFEPPQLQALVRQWAERSATDMAVCEHSGKEPQ